MTLENLSDIISDCHTQGKVDFGLVLNYYDYQDISNEIIVDGIKNGYVVSFNVNMKKIIYQGVTITWGHSLENNELLLSYKLIR